MQPDTFTEPMQVSVVDGDVVILGPNGVSGAFTVEAARKSAANLLTAAAEADRTPFTPDEA